MRITRGVKHTGQSVDIYIWQFKEVRRPRTIYSMKAQACNFVYDVFCNGKLMQFL